MPMSCVYLTMVSDTTDTKNPRDSVTLRGKLTPAGSTGVAPGQLNPANFTTTCLPPSVGKAKSRSQSLAGRPGVRLAAYAWSSYLAHGLGQPCTLLEVGPVWEHLGKSEPARRCFWQQWVH